MFCSNNAKTELYDQTLYKDNKISVKLEQTFSYDETAFCAAHKSVYSEKFSIVIIDGM